MIVVQAAAADDVFEGAARPGKGGAAVDRIDRSGRRWASCVSLLGAVCRRHAGVLERLAELTEPLRDAGLEVAVYREGADGQPLPATS